MKRLLLAALILIPLPSFAVDCAAAVSLPEKNECAFLDSQRADAALNVAYKKTLAELQDMGKARPEALQARQELIAAQRLWVKFRESDCGALWTLNKGGSAKTVVQFSCMTARALQRTKELDAEFQDPG